MTGSEKNVLLPKSSMRRPFLFNPDFYEGLLTLGQQQFEMAKLHWSFALARKLDLSGWDATETIKLFDSAEEKMKAETEVQSPSFQGYSFAEEGKVLEDGVFKWSLIELKTRLNTFMKLVASEG